MHVVYVGDIDVLKLLNTGSKKEGRFPLLTKLLHVPCEFTQ